MKKIVENIEKEMGELKRAIKVWEAEEDLTVLQMARKNLAHAYDWMALLSERMEQVSSAMECNQSISPVGEVKKNIEPLEEPGGLASTAEEKRSAPLFRENETEAETVEVESNAEQKEVPESMEAVTASLSVTTSIEEEGEADERESVETGEVEYLLSQSYEERAKNEQKNGDVISETPILGDHLLKMEEGIYASLSLNDSIRFSRAWFEEDNKQLKQFLKTIEDAKSFEQGVSLAQQKLNADTGSEEWMALVEMMDKYFND